MESVVLGCRCQALMAPPLKIDGSLLVHGIRPGSVKRADVANKKDVLELFALGPS